MAEREDALSEQVPTGRGRHAAPGKTGAGNAKTGRRAAQPAPGEDDRIETERDVDLDQEDDYDELENERFRIFQETSLQSVLPTLPKRDDYHYCWLTTSNPRDTIQNRIRMGYELITPKMLPGWDGTSLKSGEYAGCVGINEMIASRIPMRLYNRIMREVHHNMPLSEEEKLRASTQNMKQQAEQMGGRLDEGDGTAGVVQRAPVPRFVE
jgi:hypothetical protein